MKTAFSLLLFFSLTGLSAQQSLLLYVSFDKDLPLGNPAERMRILAENDTRFGEILANYAFSLRPAVTFPSQKLDEMEVEILRKKGDASSIRKLRNIFRVDFPGADDAALKLLAGELKKLPMVNYCSLMQALPVKPPADHPPVTPDYFSLQNYIGPDPGVNMEYAWDEGYFGQNVAVRDLEYGVNTFHEDLEDQNVSIAPGMTIHSDITEDYSEHGTAAIGILYNHAGNFGATGMVNGASEVILFPEYTVEAGYDRVNAVSQAIYASSPGDVIMYEMQAWGLSDYVPAEYDEPVWDLTRAASDYGIVIVAAAGNGNENLDDPGYTSYMNRGNSGAIIVGAGTPDTDHDRVSFSTYGSRVDLQGWGYDVFSTGYGDAFTINGDFNQRYTYFSGTSSATPIVASCVINLQSYYYSLSGGYYLDGAQLREILQLTGIPQGTNVTGNIGPLPDMEAAMQYISGFAAMQQLEEQGFSFYPNPVMDQLKLRCEGELSYELLNAHGQSILAGSFNGQQELSLEIVESGIYFLRASGPQGTFTKKIVKK